jgi:two-component system NtrC family sensor kinase
VASGNLEQTSDVERNDEIGELAEAFDQMTLQLRERTEEAARLYAETVQRNKELATINTQLQQMQNQLVQAEKLSAVGQLTAGIVHDVKNPLSVIKGLSEMMLSDNLDSDTKQSLTMIFESAEKANDIVTDLLKFARQSPTQANYLDMRDSVEAVLRLTAYIARKANVEIIQDLPDEPVMLWYDAQQMEQVFFNMINNAIQAMPESGTLRVSLAKANETVAIAFQDTGVGIPPENLRRIFDPFFTTKPPGQGTGLGLSVGYGVVSSHHGHIQVESTPGKGTTFTILLPVDQELQTQEG